MDVTCLLQWYFGKLECWFPFGLEAFLPFAAREVPLCARQQVLTRSHRGFFNNFFVKMDQVKNVETLSEVFFRGLPPSPAWHSLWKSVGLQSVAFLSAVWVTGMPPHLAVSPGGFIASSCAPRVIS